MDAQSPGEDLWSRWLLNRRHANDAGYREVTDAAVRRYRARVLDAAGLSSPMTLLDIGTGDGLMAFGAIDRAGPDLKVIMTDISEPLLRHAEQEAIAKQVRSQCRFIVGSAENLEGIDNATVDVATMRAVLAYVADKPKAIGEIYRVLRPGGRVSIAEPIFRDDALEACAMSQVISDRLPGGEADFFSLLHRWRSAQFPSDPAQLANNPISNFSERDLVRMFRSAGFMQIHMELHIDHFPANHFSWSIFLDSSPHPHAPALRQVIAEQMSPAEAKLFEQVMRPVIESGQHAMCETIAYLSAVKGHV